MRQQFLNARRYKRAVEQARAGTGAMPPRDLKLEALAGILSGDIRVDVHCYRAGDIAAVLTIAREFGFRVGAIHHATEAYKIPGLLREAGTRSEEHTSELQSLMRISYAVFCLKKKKLYKKL